MDEERWGGKLIAEGVGTFALVFIGAGAIITNPGNLVAIALAHGFTIAVMVLAVGHHSGAHFNPAVTLAAMATRKIKPDLAIGYILAQLLAASLAATLLVGFFPQTVPPPSTTQPFIPSWGPSNIGNPEPGAWFSGNEGQIILVEAVLTFFLVWVIFGSAVDKKGSNAVAGLAIGLTVALDIFMGGAVTGAAMNPARSFGPTLIAFAAGVDVTGSNVGLWTNHLLYWAGPVLGGLMAAGLYDGLYLRGPK